MRLSQLFGSTLRQAPAEAETVGHQLLLRAALVQQLSAGVYSTLPLGLRVLRKIEQIIREEMDAAGVDMGILVGRQAGHRIIRNDDIAELRDRYPDRFPVTIAGINGADVEAGLREIDRTLQEMDFAGIAVDPGWWIPPRYVDDPENYPLYKRCEELGGVLYLTCSLMQGPDISYAEPYRIQRVANAFPDLRIAVVHGAFPHTCGMLGVMIANAPVGNLWVIPDFFQFIPGFPGAQDWAAAASTFLGDRILYASSYPVRPLAQSLAEFQRFSYQPEVLEKLLAGNAKALFDI